MVRMQMGRVAWEVKTRNRTATEEGDRLTIGPNAGGYTHHLSLVLFVIYNCPYAEAHHH